MLKATIYEHILYTPDSLKDFRAWLRIHSNRPTPAYFLMQSLQSLDWELLARQANFSPAAMAALCSISLRQLERHFAQSFAKTPSQWAREFRIRLARNKISEGWSNKAVVAEFGFTDSPHLCREFRKLSGTTPRFHLQAPTPKSG